MSYTFTQPVGNRTDFQQLSTPGLNNNDFATPTPARRTDTLSSPLRSAVRRSTYYERESSVNPFTPRADRAMVTPGGGAATSLGRHSAGLGTVSKNVRLGGGGRALQKQSFSPMATPGGTIEDDYAMLNGGIGGWPTERKQSLAMGNSTTGAGGMELGIKSPFGARPKSPGQRSASPHHAATANKLPSFLLGPMQLSKSPNATTAGGAVVASIAATPGYIPEATSIPQLSPAAVSRQPALPISPRAPRRLSGFGSNDMLSNAYMSAPSSSSANSRSRGGGGSFHDYDAPPTLSLDDIDTKGANSYEDSVPVETMGSGMSDDDPFAIPPQPATKSVEFDGPSNESGNRGNLSGNQLGDEKDYNDVKIRSVVVSGMPAELESSALSLFRSFGDVLSFVVDRSQSFAAGNDRLAILYAEPWQAQRAISQGESAGGRVLIEGRSLAAVNWADEACVDMLFKQVFPGRKLPVSAEAPAPETFSFSESIYAQTPRAHPKRIRENARIAAAVPDNRGCGASPFRRDHQQRFPPNTVFAPSSAGIGGGHETILKVPTHAPQPRNGLLQTILDILFGW